MYAQKLALYSCAFDTYAFDTGAFDAGAFDSRVRRLCQ